MRPEVSNKRWGVTQEAQEWVGSMLVAQAGHQPGGWGEPCLWGEECWAVQQSQSARAVGRTSQDETSLPESQALRQALTKHCSRQGKPETLGVGEIL